MKRETVKLEELTKVELLRVARRSIGKCKAMEAVVVTLKTECERLGKFGEKESLNTAMARADKDHVVLLLRWATEKLSDAARAASKIEGSTLVEIGKVLGHAEAPR